MTVLGVIGDVVQLAITGTTGLGTAGGQPAEHRYNIYSGNRAYEAERADTQWSQQMQEKQRQDALTQQQYDNTASERAYQDALKQQAFNNNVTTQKLNIAKGEWALKQATPGRRPHRPPARQRLRGQSPAAPAAERPPEFASLSVLPPVEPPFPDPPAEEPDPEPPPELDESEPEPEVSELPGFPDCWASCSFCCSTLFTVAATLLLDNRSMILVLVSTMVLPLASVTSLSGLGAVRVVSAKHNMRDHNLPKHIQSWCPGHF